MTEEKRELAQRMRPQTFDEIWGNRDMVASLKALIDKEGMPQTYLFYGPAGTGKTTTARAFCNELHIDPLYIQELNASDRNGVDDIRSIISDLTFSSSQRRAIIFDEVHMLSASAQSAALKMLEEPPKNTFFFLCTTDPQKLTPAIKSRCVQFQTKLIPEKTMMRCLKKVCTSEGIDMSVDTLDIIVEKAEGTPRYALKLLDKVAGLDDESASAVLAQEGNASDVTDPNTKELCQKLMNGSWSDVTAVLKKIRGGDVESVRRAVLGYFASVLLNSGKPRAAIILEAFSENFFDSGFGGLVLACYSCFCD